MPNMCLFKTSTCMKQLRRSVFVSCWFVNWLLGSLRWFRSHQFQVQLDYRLLSAQDRSRLRWRYHIYRLTMTLPHGLLILAFHTDLDSWRPLLPYLQYKLQCCVEWISCTVADFHEAQWSLSLCIVNFSSLPMKTSFTLCCEYTYLNQKTFRQLLCILRWIFYLEVEWIRWFHSRCLLYAICCVCTKQVVELLRVSRQRRVISIDGIQIRVLIIEPSLVFLRTVDAAFSWSC